MKHTISVLVENHAGVLSRISGLFSRRGFNIESLAVGETEDSTISRMTIVVDGNDYMVEQFEKQLNKLIDVLKVRKLTQEEILSRELILVKVSVGADKRSEVIDVVRVMGAKITDITRTTVTVEMADTTEHIATLLELLRPYGIKELVRTGTVAIQKGADQISIKNKL